MTEAYHFLLLQFSNLPSVPPDGRPLKKEKCDLQGPRPCITKPRIEGWRLELTGENLMVLVFSVSTFATACC